MRPLIFLFIAALAATAPLRAQSCPANVKAIPFHSGDHHQIIVSVFINHSGPYDFLLDTGTQMTVLDQSLASELGLDAIGTARVAGLSIQGNVAYAQLDSLTLGDHTIARPGILVYDMKNLQAAGFAIRGLLGDDVLSRYDVFINHARNVLCIDETGSMRDNFTDASLTARH